MHSEPTVTERIDLQMHEPVCFRGNSVAILMKDIIFLWKHMINVADIVRSRK